MQTLTELGYRVCEAPDGPEASRILRSEPAIEVLFTDVVLPNTDLRALVVEAQTPACRAQGDLHGTGYASSSIIHGGTLDPGVDLLPKPFTAAALARKLRAALNAGRTD